MSKVKLPYPEADVKNLFIRDDKKRSYYLITVKGDIPKDFKQGDFVKLFGQIRISVDDNGKEHSNVRILSSKLLKANEQVKS